MGSSATLAAGSVTFSDSRLRWLTLPLPSRRRSFTSTRDAPSYLSLWTALDDAHAANGAVRVLPYPRDGDGESDPDPVPGPVPVCK